MSGREVEVKKRTELLQPNLKVTPGGLLDIWSGTACQSKAKIKQTQSTVKASPQRGHSLWLTQDEEVWENNHGIILERQTKHFLSLNKDTGEPAWISLDKNVFGNTSHTVDIRGVHTRLMETDSNKGFPPYCQLDIVTRSKPLGLRLNPLKSNSRSKLGSYFHSLGHHPTMS